MFLIESIITFIFAAILPHVISISVHHTALEHAFKVATIRPLKVSKSTHLIVRPRTRILASVCPEVNSLAFFHTVLKVAMVVTSIAPHLYPLTILFVLWLHFRVCVVHSIIGLVTKLLAIILSEYTKIGCPVLLPETLEHFVSWCSEHSNATSLTINPITFECTSIWPNKFTIAAFIVLVINNRLMRIILRFTLLEPILLAGINARHITVLVDCNQSDLSHVLERTEFHCFNC